MAERSWYESGSTLGLGYGLILLLRRQRQEEAYRNAERAALWESYTPQQKAAYNAALQAQRRPASSGPSAFQQAVDIVNRYPRASAFISVTFVLVSFLILGVLNLMS